jgi:hypothetical protein
MSTRKSLAETLALNLSRFDSNSLLSFLVLGFSLLISLLRNGGDQSVKFRSLDAYGS